MGCMIGHVLEAPPSWLGQQAQLSWLSPLKLPKVYLIKHLTLLKLENGP